MPLSILPPRLLRWVEQRGEERFTYVKGVSTSGKREVRHMKVYYSATKTLPDQLLYTFLRCAGEESRFALTRGELEVWSTKVTLKGAKSQYLWGPTADLQIVVRGGEERSIKIISIVGGVVRFNLRYTERRLALVVELIERVCQFYEYPGW